jgi:hypothetical protein
MRIGMGKLKYLEDNLSTSDLTWTALGLNLGLHSEKPAANRGRHGMAN